MQPECNLKYLYFHILHLTFVDLAIIHIRRNILLLKCNIN